MQGVTRKAGLSPAKRRLVDLMEAIHYGEIQGLEVRSGEPVLDPPPHVVQEIRLGKDPDRPQTRSGTRPLKPQVVDLFRRLERLGSGVVKRLDVHAGLPFRVWLDADGRVA